VTQGKKFKKVVRARRVLEQQSESHEVPGPKYYDRVKELCRSIHERNKLRSRVATDDEGYHRLVGLGPDAVPALLRRIADFKDHAEETGQHYDEFALWEPIAALYAITKADPVPREHQGRLMPIIDDWLEWGRGEGHEW
jgi:hypothetical protein